MKIAIQSCLAILAISMLLGPSSADEPIRGTWQNQLLPGQQEFTFTMYGSPGRLEELQELVAVMKEKGLGNGFDPGPAARASSRPLFEYLATIGWPIVCYPGWSDMQVKDGRSRLNDEDEAAVQILDRAGVFSAIQLGEWGYYFHNLSSNQDWWQAVYGKELDQYQHQRKPPGLKGYDRHPTDGRECYEALKDYFLTRNRAMRGRTISVTGHSHYEAYAAEWGAQVIGLELGENIAFTQSKIAFARGASRQWQRPWSIQVSPWFSGACTTSGPLRREGKDARGLDAGHSLSFYERMWLHGWFAGAAMVTPENSIAIFFESPRSPWKLTSHGEKAQQVLAFMRSHDRGVPFTPVAVVLDHLAGYNAYQGRPWGILEKTVGDQETYDLFEQQIFPGSDHIHVRPDPNNPEASYLRPTPYGEMFDVLLSSASVETLQRYETILLVGDIHFTDEFVDRLSKSVHAGSRLLIHQRHADSLGTRLSQLNQAGEVELLLPWTNPATGRTAAISHERLAQLADKLLPVAITGDPVQYQINRNRRGWVVELVNNSGVLKTPDQPVRIDSDQVAHVVLHPRVGIDSAVEWRTADELPTDQPLTIDVPAGQTRFVELVLLP